MLMKVGRYCKKLMRMQPCIAISKKALRMLVFLGIALLTSLGISLGSAAFAHFGTGMTHEVNSRPPVTLSLSAYLDTDERISTLLSEGQRQYDSGQIAAALLSWQQSAEALTAYPLQQAIAFSYVSIAAQDLGEWDQAEAAMSAGLSILDLHSDKQGWKQAKAQLLNVQGRLYLNHGKPEMAWEAWLQAEAAYSQANDDLGQWGAQINQSQALQTMGLYRRARLQLESVATLLADAPDSRVKAITLKSLGNVFQTAGSLEQSQQYLSQSLTIYRRLGSDIEVADTLFSLANTLRLMKDNVSAGHLYREVENLTPHSILMVRSQLNRFSLLLGMQDWEAAERMLPELVVSVETLPASRQAIYARVNLAESLLSYGDETHQPVSWLTVESTARMLRESLSQAEVLNDNRAEAFSLGALSKLYGYTQQWSESEALAKRALSFSQNDNSQDLAYRWYRQLGMAYHQQGKDEDAISSYTEAVSSLGKIRRDLLATNTDVQYAFRETVEPVYRELVSLLLLPEEASQGALSQARNTIEELQLAELENYFKSACVDSTSDFIDRLDTEAAVIYPIILSDRVEVIVSIPELPLKHYRTWQTEAATNDVINNLYRHFNPALSVNRRLTLSEEIYDWLVAPAEETLAERDIKTLVFVLDGQFRKLPMAALYDGEHYLLENYGVALTPGLKLLGPHFQSAKPLQALMMGLTESRDGFSALPGVKTELEQVATHVNAEVLFDQAFTKESLADEVGRGPFPV
mgnify:CR=1 FL=1